ncbi:AAA family ATPase [Virgibacillus profundi]|uniref:AAA family ATPase n=1 Tax=Virgibacillus profundi TaxID=2024555 RepID=A0A2A2ICY0_9BACI|nr:MoxR family ATPase [Virgibacillus profundi]PAV29589.1 AAA family ATPase [Virgibacillus profundi]PXY53761.1 MoxR family ATPase [Virgibacillus profundi]
MKEKSLQETIDKTAAVKAEIATFIVGQDEVIDQVLWTIVAGGHALLEGLPGLGKTMLVRTISDVMDLKFSRIQFTPDLMPSDITGTMMIEPSEDGKQSFVFHEGPIFANIVLADEINRATPKTQSSLLEAMGERTVTVMGDTKHLQQPFFVLATQNPIDLEGTYPLPEAQMDRFLVKINIDYPSRDELKQIAVSTTGTLSQNISKIIDAKGLIEIQQLALELLVSEEILDYAVNLIMATHPGNESSPESVKKFVRYGSGPRGLQSLIKIAKARALMNGRYHVSKGDIKHAARPVLRHRLFLNFEGEATGITSEEIINEIIAAIGSGMS